MITELANTLERSNTQYLAHEFMNMHWHPCFGMDVAAAMSEAKLEWIASSSLTDNFPELMLTEPQREIFNRYSDPLMQELIKDMCVSRGLHHDVFVRGARRINLTERAAALMDVNLMLLKPASELPEAIAMPAGSAELNKEFYLPIVKALSVHPGRVGRFAAVARPGWPARQSGGVDRHPDCGRHGWTRQPAGQRARR